MPFEEFQDGGHLGYRNGTNLVILKLHVAPIPTPSFSLIRHMLREEVSVEILCSVELWA